MDPASSRTPVGFITAELPQEFLQSNSFFFFLFVFCLLRAAPAAYGDSQARGLIRATVAGLHHSHSHSHASVFDLHQAHGNAGSLTH